MSTGAAPVTPMPTPVNPAAMNPSVGVLPANAQIVTPGGGALNYAAQGGMWGQVQQVLGKTASDFMDSLGDTPEERQQNLEMFTKAVGTMNQLGNELGQSSLVQRLGAKRQADIFKQQQAAAAAPPLAPTPVPSPDELAAIMENVGMGVQGIRQATDRDIATGQRR